MLLAGIQAEFGLDPRLKHSGVTVLGVASLDPSQIFEGERLPRPSPPNVLIGGPVPVSGFLVKAWGNDGLVGELGVEEQLHFHALWASVRS